MQKELMYSCIEFNGKINGKIIFLFISPLLVQQ